jgi:hypothetical protein
MVVDGKECITMEVERASPLWEGMHHHCPMQVRLSRCVCASHGAVGSGIVAPDTGGGCVATAAVGGWPLVMHHMVALHLLNQAMQQVHHCHVPISKYMATRRQCTCCIYMHGLVQQQCDVGEERLVKMTGYFRLST